LRLMKKQTHLFYAQLTLTLLMCVFLIVPVIQSVMAGVTVNYFVGIKSGLTLKWLKEVWRLYSDTIFRSIYIGLTCLAVDIITGIPAAYVMVKCKNRLTRVIEELLVIPLAIPGLAIALGILICYGRWTTFRMSWFIILAGHVIFTLPFMIRSVIAVMSSFNMLEMEEGAASLGAGFWNRFFEIVIPNAKSGILAGSLMVFTLSIGEFNLTWMLHTPLTKTLPVGLADSYASMRLEIGSAYTIVFFFMIIPILMAMQWIGKSKSKFSDKPAWLDRIRRPQQVMKVRHCGVAHLQETRFSDKQSIIHLTSMKKLRQYRSHPLTPETSSGNLTGDTKTGISIRVKNCSKTFPDGTRALNSTNLSVEGGESIVILGPSGCGKTTILRIIAGLEMPDSDGKVFFEDEDVTKIPIENRNVGMVFQSYALFPNMNVADNIAYGLKVRGDVLKNRQRRVDEMLEMMQIAELKYRNINQLSGGQKQRVALARAIAIRPRVLLLDEPLTALDAKLRDVLRIEIEHLLKFIGITSIYVTHDQSEAMALGDRIVVMKKGGIAQVGTPREIYFKPANRFVAEFIGAINRIKCRVEGDKLVFPYNNIRLNDATNITLAKEEELEIFFRPEHVTIAETGTGHLEVTVDSAIFTGDRTQLVVSDIFKNLIRMEAPGKITFRKGESIEIRLDSTALFTMEE